MSWYKTGYDEREEPVERDWGPRRYWLKLNTEGSVTIVDDDTKKMVIKIEEGGKTQKVRIDLPFLYHEHQLYLDGNWFNYFTCRTPLDGNCPLCTSGDNPSQVAAYTIVDHNKWKDKQGKDHVDELKLFIFKTSVSTFKILEKASAKRKGLRGVRFDVGRYGDKSCNVGDSFDFDSKNDIPDDVVPFNYLDVLAPKTVAELKEVIGATDDEEEEPVAF